LAGSGRADNSPPLGTPSDATPVATSVESQPADGDALLKEKLAELERLQAEIQKLRQAAEGEASFRFDVKIYELSLTKLQQLGIDPAKLGLAPAAADRRQITEQKSYRSESPLLVASADSAVAAGLVAMLRPLGVLKEISTTPSQTTPAGRTAYFFSPGELSKFPLVSHYKESDGRKLGMQIELTSTRAGERQIRLGVRAKATEVDPSMRITLNGSYILGFKVQEMLATCDVALGDTALLVGLIQSGRHVAIGAETENADDRPNIAEETLILLLVTPHLLDPPAK
jgi:hypothetical protein